MTTFAPPRPTDHAWSWDDILRIRGFIVCGKCRRPKVEHPQ